MLFVLLTAFIITYIGAYLFKTRHVDKQRIASINEHVAKSILLLPPPAPISGTVLQQKVVSSVKQPLTQPTLTQGQLEPLRSAFKNSRDKIKGQLPKNRTILLSKRTIEVPEERSLPADFALDQSPTQRDSLPYIVHFGQPITGAMRQGLEKNGALLRGYLAHYAFLTELSAAALRAIANNPDVHFVTEFLPKDKIQPFLSSLTATIPGNETLQLSIQTLDPLDTKSVEELVAALGGEVNHTTRLPEWGVIRATLPLSEIPALTQRGEVQWVEEFVPPKLLNDYATLPSHLNAVAVQNEWYLTGQGQIIGHADTGIDTGNEATIHPDFQGQIAAIFDLANNGTDAADYHGHGTHTAGSICGSGASSQGQYKGIAYDAKLIAQCIVDKTTGHFTGIYDLYAMYMQSYLNGATIHSDS